ncbi:ABC transporter permease, partial [bacterium]|nr:ABC transporter permease [bacterium]
MIVYVARRLALLIPTLLGVSVVSFFVVHWMPGDPAEILAGEHASREVVEQIRHDLGLDRPLPQQYGRWVAGLLRGDLGRSAKTHEAISTEIAHTFPATVELATAALLLATFGGVALGLAAARRPGGMVDAGSMSVASIGVSMPVFWLGLLLMYTFAVRFPVLPVSGRGLATDDTPFRTGFLIVDALLAGRPESAWTTLRHLILPAIVLGTVPTAIIAR